jgi:fimbrial chaperone protein
VIFAVPASAGSLKVNPVQITLPAARQSTSVRMTNGDAVPVSVRVVTLAWTQADGRDVYAATGNVIASPPMFTIAPGQTQLVRIGLRQRTGAGAYRVIFEEIPRQQSIDGQIQINMRLNLPLYVLPKGGGKADLSWSAWRDSAGEIMVEGRNRGSLHRQVAMLAADQAGTRTILSTEMGVVLPGSARQWKIGRRPQLAAAAPFVLLVKGPAGETRSSIILERR